MHNRERERKREREYEADSLRSAEPMQGSISQS